MQTNTCHSVSFSSKNKSLQTIQKIASPRLLCDVVFFIIVYVICIFITKDDILRNGVCLLCMLFLLCTTSSADFITKNETLDGSRIMILLVSIWMSMSFVYAQIGLEFDESWIWIIYVSMILLVSVRFIPFRLKTSPSVALTIKMVSCTLYQALLFFPAESTNAFLHGPGTRSIRLGCLFIILYTFDFIRESIESEFYPWPDMLFMVLSMPLYMVFEIYPVVFSFMFIALGLFIYNRKWGTGTTERQNTETETVSLFEIGDEEMGDMGERDEDGSEKDTYDENTDGMTLYKSEETGDSDNHEQPRDDSHELHETPHYKNKENNEIYESIYSLDGNLYVRESIGIITDIEENSDEDMWREIDD